MEYVRLSLSLSLLFALTCLHEWRVLERSGARAHLRGRTTCPAVVVVVVVERARSLSPFHSLSLCFFYRRARARAPFRYCLGLEGDSPSPRKPRAAVDS